MPDSKFSTLPLLTATAATLLDFFPVVDESDVSGSPGTAPKRMTMGDLAKFMATSPSASPYVTGGSGTYASPFVLDVTAFNAALTEGATFEFGPYVYSVNAKIDIGADRVTIRGKGTSTIFKWTGASGGTMFYVFGETAAEPTQAQMIQATTLSDFVIDGTGTCGKGIHAYNTQKDRFWNIDIVNTQSTGTGVYIDWQVSGTYAINVRRASFGSVIPDVSRAFIGFHLLSSFAGNFVNCTSEENATGGVGLLLTNAVLGTGFGGNNFWGGSFGSYGTGSLAAIVTCDENVFKGVNLEASNRTVTDAVTNGTTTVTSATMQFAAMHVGNSVWLSGGTGSLTRVRKTIVSVTNATTVVLDSTVPAGTGVTLLMDGVFIKGLRNAFEQLSTTGSNVTCSGNDNILTGWVGAFTFGAGSYGNDAHLFLDDEFTDLGFNTYRFMAQSVIQDHTRKTVYLNENGAANTGVFFKNLTTGVTLRGMAMGGGGDEAVYIGDGNAALWTLLPATGKMYFSKSLDWYGFTLDAANERLGFGTNSPSFSYHFVRDSAGTVPMLVVQNTNTGGGQSRIALYADGDAGGTSVKGFVINAVAGYCGLVDYEARKISFWTGTSAGTTNERCGVLNNADGMYFGSAADTNLYRSAENVLKTDDHLEVVQSLKVSKRIAAGAGTVAYAATVTPNCDDYNTLNIGTLTGTITVNNPTGTPVDGQTLVLIFTQDGTGHAVTLGTSGSSNIVYGTDITASDLPTTASKSFEVCLKWHASTSKWRVVSLIRGF
jgi:hypothetical protein